MEAVFGAVSEMTHCLYAVDVAPLNNQFNSKQSREGFIRLLVSSCWPSIPQGSVVHCCTDNISTILESSGFHLQGGGGKQIRLHLKKTSQNEDAELQLFIPDNIQNIHDPNINFSSVYSQYSIKFTSQT